MVTRFRTRLSGLPCDSSAGHPGSAMRAAFMCLARMPNHLRNPIGGRCAMGKPLKKTGRRKPCAWAALAYSAPRRTLLCPNYRDERRGDGMRHPWRSRRLWAASKGRL